MAIAMTLQENDRDESDETECGRPCAPEAACDECAEYWHRMQTEGYWDRERHRWTDKGWREIMRPI